VSPIPVYGDRVRPALLPVGWIDESSALTPELAKEFRNTV
jgi:hypothetical protein